MYSSQVSLGIAFIAGLASFLSPCVLPLVPIYLAQLVGQSVSQAQTTLHGQVAAPKPLAPTRLATFLHAAIFVFGFTLSFVALGATASTLGSFLRLHLVILRQVGGILMILIGLHLTGILKLPFLYQQKRFTFTPTRPGYPASFLIGIIFAIAWTPCIGPILTSILILAANAPTLQQGVWLLLAYSLGLGVPFLFLGLGLNQLSRALKWLKPHLGKIEIATGLLMIVVGMMIFFNMLTYLNQYFNFGITV
ncbi:MAG: cytochrome c biogenesis protein CcdA [Ktedonobacteraceae bacterium]